MDLAPTFVDESQQEHVASCVRFFQRQIEALQNVVVFGPRAIVGSAGDYGLLASVLESLEPCEITTRMGRACPGRIELMPPSVRRGVKDKYWTNLRCSNRQCGRWVPISGTALEHPTKCMLASPDVFVSPEGPATMDTSKYTELGAELVQRFVDKYWCHVVPRVLARWYGNACFDVVFYNCDVDGSLIWNDVPFVWNSVPFDTAADARAYADHLIQERGIPAYYVEKYVHSWID